MKKLLITTAIALSVTSLAFAQTSTSTATSTTSTTTVDVSTDVKLGAQIKLLQKEMEAKIKAIRDDYQARIKTLIAANATAKKAAAAARKAGKASSTRPISEADGSQPEVLGTTTAQLRVLNNQGATTTKATPKGNAWGFLMRFFGAQPRPAATSTR